MTDVKKPIQAALENLEEMQAFESSYAQINKVQSIINTFANLERVCDMMAETIAEKENCKPEEILREYFTRNGLI